MDHLSDDAAIEKLREKMLKKELWAIVGRNKPGVEHPKSRVRAHLEHQIALEKTGVLFGAGPCFDPRTNKAAFSLIVIRAKDETEARAIAESDPLVQGGGREVEVYKWSVNEGSFTVTINLSDQTYRFV